MSKTSPSSPCRIYGRWIRQETIVPPDRLTPIVVHVYDIPIPPPQPLVVGLRVQLIALSPVAYHTPGLSVSAPRYDTYDPQIEGTVVALKSLGKSVVEFIVNNDRPGKVQYAYVAMQYVPGVTAKMGLWETTCHWMFAHEMRDCRPVLLEANAQINDNLPHSPTPRAQFTYPNPELGGRDTLLVGVRVGQETRGGPKKPRPQDGRSRELDG